MKKLLLVIIFLLVGCGISPEKQMYLDYVSELEESNSVTEDAPFSIELQIEKVIDEEITYRVIIDEPTEPIYDIQALVIHNYDTEDIFPTIGIFDSALNLIPDTIDKDNNIVKGIVLVGYISFVKDIEEFDGEIKVLIKYETEPGKINTVYYK